MQRYLSTARRYRWLLAALLAVVWGAGLAAAAVEYSTTYESVATIWVLRASPELTQTDANDPNIPIVQTAATQQAELINQLLQTRSFLHDVVAATSLRPAMEAATDEKKYLEGIRRQFRVQTLGTNLMSVACTGHDPSDCAELVKTAIALRNERVSQARIDATAAVNALYSKDYDVAQTQALEAQRKLEEFNATHRAPLSDIDQHLQAQLRLSLDLAQVRLADLRGRMDRSVLAPALLEISGMEFQVIDEPRVESTPSGGLKPAVSIMGVAFMTGLVLSALLVVIGALLTDHVASPADVQRLAPARLFATIPRLVTDKGEPDDLRAALTGIALRSNQREPQPVDR
jgi:hypothetical protein